MEVFAKLKYVRIAPRKVRLLADLVRGKKAIAAQTILKFTNNKSAGVILKLLNQAIASAKNNFKISEDNLRIAEISIDAGPILKRFRPRARGSAYEIQKKTSHINLILTEINKSQKTDLAEVSQNVAKEEAKKETVVETKEVKAVKKSEKVKVSSSAKPVSQKQAPKIFRRQTF
jgi:large subunit ribosomal protein L22